MKRLSQIVAWVIILGAIAYDDARTKYEDWKEKRLRKKVLRKLNDKRN